MGPRGREDVRFETRAAFVAALLLVAAFVGTCFAVAEEPRWRARYFADRAFTARSVVRWEEQLRFDWGRRSPDPSIPHDRFSARFETCLLLPTTRSVAFLLTSDDDASLAIDGERVLELPGRHPLKSRGMGLELEAGVHHLRVDYAETTGVAAVGLSASLNGRAPKQISNEHLRRPSGEGCVERR